VPGKPWERSVADPPTNAWLLIGDEASFPDQAELDYVRKHWRYDDSVWTSPKQAQPGDLLFFYFMSPAKEIRFAARAASYPYFDAALVPNSLRNVSDKQWWVRYTPMVELNAVPYLRLQELMDGHLILRGRPVHYLPPVVANKILKLGARGRQLRAVDASVLQKPVGDPNLPDPSRMTLKRWRSLSQGPLQLERQVEEYVVEPLLRLALPQDSSISWKRAVRLQIGVPDYVVYRDGVPSCAVEVKVGVREARTRDRWSDSPDFRQVQRYARELGVGSALIDSNRVFLLGAKASKPKAVLLRKECSPDDLMRIGRHLSGA
jgi:hypothetical protein